MNAQPIATDQLIDSANQVDTTSDYTGYPRGLRVAYTADTMAELREIKEAAEAEGRAVEVVTLERRDGWALWHRRHDHDLNDDRWKPSGEDWSITIIAGDDPEDLAYTHVVGDGMSFDNLDYMRSVVQSIEELAADLPDPDALEEGEAAVAVLDDMGRIKWTWTTGQNGYQYDTRHYRTGLLIGPEPEEEEDEDED